MKWKLLSSNMAGYFFFANGVTGAGKKGLKLQWVALVLFAYLALNDTQGSNCITFGVFACISFSLLEENSFHCHRRWWCGGVFAAVVVIRVVSISTKRAMNNGMKWQALRYTQLTCLNTFFSRFGYNANTGTHILMHKPFHWTTNLDCKMCHIYITRVQAREREKEWSLSKR